jgi:hypothetical protein
MTAYGAEYDEDQWEVRYSVSIYNIVKLTKLISIALGQPTARE